jgi:tetratricopeptide (TPR) repeat protein
MASHPIFGIGPNRFSDAWVMAKPANVNTTPFWNTQFNYSIGLIPTFLITTGLIGFLLWIGFFAYFLWLGFRSLFTKKSNPFAEYLTVSSFIIALYFWIFAIAYVPSATLLFLTFFFTGLFLASIADTGLIKRWTFDFSTDPKISFVSVLVFVVLLLIGLMAIYGITRRFVAVIYYNQALIEANSNGSVSAAQNDLLRAIEFHADDLSYRTLAQLDLISIKSLISQPQRSQTAAQSQFQQLLSQAEAAASAAQNANPNDYQNSLTLGQVAESVVPLNVAGASTTALADYERAQKLDPTDPSIYLQMAQLGVDENNPAVAEQYIASALKLKNDYTNAIFLLAQIQVAQGDTANAIKSLQAATLISPNDAGLQFNLGLLYYDTKDWADASSAFEQSIGLVPYYANAQYFLGLSLANQGDIADALKEFQNLLVSNPGNSNVTTIIANLQAGRDPLAGLQPPANTPQKAPNPPVKDATTQQTNGTAGR